MRTRTLPACVLLLALIAPGTPAMGSEPEEAQRGEGAAIRGAIERGVAFLVRTQKKDGSWGSPASNLHDLYAPAPGSQRTFQVASAALALSGLLEAGDDSPEVKQAVERATVFLLKRYAVRRIRPDTLYNTWALGYSLQAFGRLLDRVQSPVRRREIRTAAQNAVRLLDKWEFVDGGWGYYNFSEQPASPGRGSASFTTATCLTGMSWVAEYGVRVPGPMLRRALASIRRCWRPDNSFYYGPEYIYYGVLPVNKIKGSLARTPVCLLALDLWSGDATRKPVPTESFVKALDDLERYGHFLRIARKYPNPHEAWYQNSGYFVLYGYHYASLTLDRVPSEKRREHQRNIGRHVRRMQEKDGSFWDYQLFSYHKVYGTGYALIALARCLPGFQPS